MFLLFLICEHEKKAGRKQAESRQKVSRMQAESRQKVGRKQAESRQKVGRMQAESRQKAGRKQAESRQKAGRKQVNTTVFIVINVEIISLDQQRFKSVKVNNKTEGFNCSNEYST
jgi:hypothetical protein